MHTRGFTLLEMMVVIGIVAILALMAIPTYQDKFIRDQIAEALPLADIASGRPVVGRPANLPGRQYRCWPARR